MAGVRTRYRQMFDHVPPWRCLRGEWYRDEIFTRNLLSTESALTTTTEQPSNVSSALRTATETFLAERLNPSSTP
jgi:hypothetical protein